ncbi:hypothetical protein [Tenacibaculum discolor]|uniref:hypothetical protein n=1 Tax=Tenacibaculum discolor TaxID=361581 RepID=UPI000F5B0935|nr:hypothetical protein [Tenacibaculum discolor]
MKNLFFLFTITLLFSCSDSVEIPITENTSFIELEGTWNLTSLTSEYTTKVTSRVLSYDSKSNIHGEDYNFSFNFSQNSNKYTTKGAVKIVTKTKINDKVETTNHNATAIQGLSAGKWEVKGKELIFKNGNSNVIQSKFTVESFSKNRMVLKQDLSENKVVDNDVIKTEGTATIVLER